MNTRREFLGGCAALVALIAAPEAVAGRRRRAPRVSCPHDGCRHHRVGGQAPGLCGLSLTGGRIAYADEVLP